MKKFKKFNKKLLLMLFMTLTSFGIYQRLNTETVFATNVENENNQSPQSMELSIQQTQDSDYDKLTEIFMNLYNTNPDAVIQYIKNKTSTYDIETAKELLKNTKPNDKLGGTQENFTLKQGNKIVGMISLLHFDLPGATHAYTNLNIEDSITPFVFVSKEVDNAQEFINNAMSNLISSLVNNSATVFFQCDMPTNTLDCYGNLKDTCKIEDLKIKLPKSEVIEYIKKQKEENTPVSEENVRNEIRKEFKKLQLNTTNTADQLNKYLITNPEFFEGEYNLSLAYDPKNTKIDSIVKGVKIKLNDEIFIQHRLADMYFETGVQTMFEKKGKKYFEYYISKFLNPKSNFVEPTSDIEE